MAGPTRIRRALAGLSSLLLAAGVLALVVPAAARADSSPPSGSTTPVTASADSLPTVQINGVVWAQTVIGNTVYATGSFSQARPAGAAAGSQQTARSNILAYDITTGNLITSWAPTLNGQGLAITHSPDNSRIYVAGDFTSVSGQPRNRIAALDPATGAVISTWRPSVSGQVRAIAATNSTVYFGGSVSAVGGVSRTRLAAVTAADGTLLPWAPQPGYGSTAGNRDGNTTLSNNVMALVVTGSGTVVAGGRFDSLNGIKATGVGALEPTTGATLPFAVNALITNQGVNSAIYSLITSADGSVVYGSAYDYYGPGDLEGTFAAQANGGALIEVQACHGDTYSTVPMNGVLYVASHTHNCNEIGGSPEFTPRVEKHGTAYTTTAVTKVRWGADVHWVNQPAGQQLAWNPDLAIGSVTGQYQAAWSVTGNGTYLSYGGEFPRVNGGAQQGLVRFAMPNAAPNKVGPTGSGFAASVASPQPGVARISWKATWDEDNEFLTYRVLRDGGSTPVCTVTRASRWWNLPMLGCSDPVGGGAHTYRVTASDPFGNSAATPTTSSASIPAGTPSSRPYVAAVAADGATDHWALDETSGNTAYSDLGGTDLTTGSGVGHGGGGAITDDTDPADTFNGTTSGIAAATTPIVSPDTFSLEAWFRTSSTSGGKIVGFGNSNSGTSSQYDRHVYMDGSGRVLFGVNYQNSRTTVSSGTGFNNGQYHHVVATLGSGGMQLYIDGTLRGSRTDATFGLQYTGYWRVGGDATWSGAQDFTGALDEVAVYPNVLTAAQVTNHYTLGHNGTVTNQPPTASFTHTETGLTTSVNAAGSHDDGTITGYAWNFGDGGTGTGQTASHPYSLPGTYPVTLTVTDNQGVTGTTSQQVTVAAPANQPPVAAFSTTTSGLTASFDSSGSHDTDGTITAYAWNFGDGGTDTTSSPSHPYAVNGTYNVTLTVTDDQGSSTPVTHSVTVNDGTALATDGFGRTVSGGWGSADVGGPWTSVNGAARLAVTPGGGNMSLASSGNLDNAFLQSVSQTGANVLAKYSLDAVPAGGSADVYVTGRRISAGNEYRVRVRVLANGSVAVALTRLSGGAETWPAGESIVPGLTYTAGATLDVRFVVTGTGTTQEAATVWLDGSPEPATPTMSTSDTTAALQAAGGLGLAAYRQSGATNAVTVRFSSYTAVPA